jgi:AcrR family transcriptional regulator
MQSLSYSKHLKAALKAAPEASKGQRTRARMLCNVAVVMERHGLASDLVARACALSRVSRGTFYTYFADSMAAAMEVAAGFLDTAGRWAADLPREGDLYGLVREAIAFEARLHAENPGLLRCIYVLDPFSTANKRPYRLWQKVRHEWRVALARALSERMGTATDERATLHLVYGLASMVDDVLFQRYVSENPFFNRTIDADSEMIELLAILWYRTLTGRNPPGRRLNPRSRPLARLLTQVQARLG